MQELTDDQLDGLFRKSAEEFDPPFDPAAWQSMQSQLDAQNSAPAGQTLFRKKLIRWGLPPLLLLLIGTGWYTYQNRSVMTGKVAEQVRGERDLAKTGPALATRVDLSRPKEPSKATDERAADAALTIQTNSSTPRPVQPEVMGVDEPTSTLANNLTEPNNPALITSNSRKSSTKKEFTPKAHRAILLIRSAIRPNRSNNLVAGFNVKQKRNPFGGQRSAPTYSPAGHTIKATSTFSKQLVTNELVEEGIITTTEPPSSATLASVSLPSLTTLLGKPGRWSVYSTLINREVTRPNAAEQPRVSKPTPRQLMGLSIRLAVSPDLSTIGLRDFSRPGTNVGMLLEYRLASRWSVQAGVLQSTKIYRGSTSQYELPPYLAKLRVPPESVNGRCSMLDIPVNLRYDVALRPRSNGQAPSRWFVSGGATTYIMRQEDYDYTYPAGTHLYPSTPKGWHGNTGKWFTLSQLNLSGGYERTISRKLSWQVEPFVKVPLRSVGYLKLNLLSTGAFFSLRYKL